MCEKKNVQEEPQLSTFKNCSLYHSEHETFQTDCLKSVLYDNDLNKNNYYENLGDNLSLEDNENKDYLCINYFENENNITLNIKEKDDEKEVINDAKNMVNEDTEFIGKKRKEIINFQNFKIFKEASNEFKELINNKKNKKNIHFQIYEKIPNPNLIILEYRSDTDSIAIKDKIKLKKKKVVKKRKEQLYDIRKKIKSNFLKSLKNKINLKLESAGSEKLLDFLPQNFVSDVSKNINKEVMKLTFRELLETDFHSNISNPKKKKINKAKYTKNLKVLKYLEKNKEIVKKSEFDIISNMRYKDILKEYFMSEEFEKSIHKLKEKNESEEYINDYISNAINYINFFMNHKKDMNQESDYSCKNDENESL